MRYFSLLVLVEGPSDEAFLRPLLDRSVNDLMVRLVEPEVAVDVDVQVLRAQDGSRRAGIAKAVEHHSPPPDALVIHFDAGSDMERERAKYFDPLVQDPAVDWPSLVPLAPVRETEAWVLADLDALPNSLTRSLDAVALPEGTRLEQPEALMDPKAVLQAVFASSARSRRRSPRAADFLPLLGERMPLSSLRRLPSFNAFEAALTDVLHEKGWTR